MNISGNFVGRIQSQVEEIFQQPKNIVLTFQQHLTYSVSSLGEECLINAVKTSMSSKLIGADSEFFSKMVVDAANAIKVFIVNCKR
jgi:chaperonin GroEL (HSP60 family)